MICKKENIFVSAKNLILIIFLFLTSAFTIRSFKEVNMNDLLLEGDEFISKKDLIDNSSLILPRKLIFIQTRLLEKELKKKLSLKNISINRRLIPFGLKIYLETRDPFAYAEFEKLDKKIYGYVDLEGVFIPKEFASIREKNILPITVIGWKKDFIQAISKIFTLYENNINDLKFIYIASDNLITLEDKVLKKILIGYDYSKIDQQIKLISAIKKQLKQKDIIEKVKILDIMDIDNPKIKVFKP